MDNEALLDVIPQLYAAFADEPHPGRVNGCTNCCISQEELDFLSITVREAVPADMLKFYAYNVPDTVGTEKDFRYFLPRILEASVKGEFTYPDLPWLIRRLTYVPWHTAWTAEQQSSVREFLRVWWLGLIQAEAPDSLGGIQQDQWDLEEALATLQNVALDAEFQKLLHLWTSGGRSARVRLARFTLEHSTELALGKKWDEWATADGVKVVTSWLRSGPPAQALWEEFDRAPDAPGAELFFEAASLLS